jgi:2-polyprenyl-3-methyl-5-hydroxy-6-metoxy-1,4-benzoquinol methylase
MDITNFLNSEPAKDVNFIQCDLNDDFGHYPGKFNIIVTSEVIEHIENPRHFLRQIDSLLHSNGHLLLSTPNIESITSILNFIIRGHHGAFGPRNYPAHITPLATWDIKNIVSEIPNLYIQQIYYIPNDHIPATTILWKDIFPWVAGKRFSQNYLVHIRKR